MSKTLDEWWNEARTSHDTDIILYSREEFLELKLELSELELELSKLKKDYGELY